MATYCQVNSLVTCRLTAVHRDQLWAQCSVTSMGELLPFYLYWLLIHRFIKFRLQGCAYCNLTLTLQSHTLTTFLCSWIILLCKPIKNSSY